VSRRAARSRGRQRAAKAVPPSAGGGATFTADQVTAMMTAQRQLSSGNSRATPLATSPLWETAPFGPGRRLIPAPINVPRADTGRAEPRLWEFPVSWNLQIDDRWHVPWHVLQRAADMPLFRKCIERRKNVCQLDFAVTVDPRAVAAEVAASGAAKQDVESALRKKYISEIARISDWLQVPDRKNDLDWPGWTSLLMENRLKFDAAVVYPRRTYGGDLYSFEVIDGKTIKPLIDEYGGRPLPPLPAFQQVLFGFPRGEFTAPTDGPDGRPVDGGFPSDQLYYERSIYRSESPYGMSPTEIALFDGLLWMRRMGWMMSEYTEGVAPTGLLETSPETEWTPRQWEDWARALNDHLSGNTAERHRWPLMPPGVKFIQGEEPDAKYHPDYDLFLIKLIAGDFGLPASEVGFTEAGALGASFHEGEEDILERATRKPDRDWLGRYATKLCRRELGMPAALQVEVLGLEWEDEAAADAIADQRVRGGRATLNEDRAKRGEPPYNFAAADMPMLITPRGIVFIEGAEKAAPPGELIGPVQAPKEGEPPEGQQADAGSEGGGQDGEGEPQPKAPPASKSGELAALRKWLARHPSASRPFACQALTAADAPQYADDPRVLLKDGPGKALAGTGPAGRGTWTS